MGRTKDAIIIGAGQSGPFLAARLAAAGQKVALIERGNLGGTCVNNGCTPTKTMVASARVAWLARRAAEFGVSTGPVSVDFAAVKARKDRIVANAVQGLEDWLGGMENVEIVRGEGRLAGSHDVAVGGDTLTAPRIFINAGGRPVIPDWPGLDAVPYLTSVSMMDLAVLPEHLIIVGGSYVGLEFAQVFRRLGARVTVIDKRKRLLAKEDEDISSAIRRTLENEGIEFILGASDFAVSGEANAIRLELTAPDRRTIAGSHLLVAIGRRPNTESLGLAEAGVGTDERGYIVVDNELRTSADGIWAMGDITGHGAFTHSSYNDFQIVAANLLGEGGRSLKDRIPAYALYTDPPLGRVGMSEAAVRRSGKAAMTATLPMTRVQRAKERGETDGLLKILVSAQTQQILGASLLGIEADEMVHAVIDIMAGGVPAPVIARTMHIHPTVSEYLPVLLSELKPLDPN